jgi:hypothetical protein
MTTFHITRQSQSVEDGTFTIEVARHTLSSPAMEANVTMS